MRFQVALTMALGLCASACTELAVNSASTGAAQRVYAPGIPIAVESVSGAPGSVATGFNTALVDAATERQVELVGASGKARYRIKGYLSAESTAEGKSELTFVWDVFDSAKQRAQRLTGATIGGSASAASPWSGVDQAVATRAASDSMDVIAAFLRDSNASSADTTATEGAAARSGRTARAGSSAL
jgi:hypothetical protein